MTIQENLIKQCIEIIKRDDIKNELVIIIKPFIELILLNIYPYIYISLLLVIISFLLILGIFILVLKNTKTISNISKIE